MSTAPFSVESEAVFAYVMETVSEYSLLGVNQKKQFRTGYMTG
jgi:hypothetical protein